MSLQSWLYFMYRGIFLVFVAAFNQQCLPRKFLSCFANEIHREEVPLQKSWVLLMALCVLFVDHSKIKE